MKKGLLSFILLILFAAGVFYAGWVQVKVPSDAAAVIVTKTNGVDPVPVKNGKLIWRWQALLPTNLNLIIFSQKPYTFTKSVSGELPSASIYSQYLKEQPDFSYSFRFDVCLSVKTEGIVKCVTDYYVSGDSDIEKLLEDYASKICDAVSLYILENSQNNPHLILELSKNKSLVNYVSRLVPQEIINVDSVRVLEYKVPDTALYNIAKESFVSFHRLVDEKLSQGAEEQAKRILEDDRGIKRLSKLGQTLQQYPELTDILKNSDTAAIIKSFNMD